MSLESPAWARWLTKMPVISRFGAAIFRPDAYDWGWVKLSRAINPSCDFAWLPRNIDYTVERQLLAIERCLLIITLIGISLANVWLVANRQDMLSGEWVSCLPVFFEVLFSNIVVMDYSVWDAWLWLIPIWKGDNKTPAGIEGNSRICTTGSANDYISHHMCVNLCASIWFPHKQLIFPNAEDQLIISVFVKSYTAKLHRP